MSIRSDYPNEVNVGLQSVTDAVQGGSTPALAAALIDLLWSVSDARPDLDQLPVNISRTEQKIRESGKKGDIVTLGLSVKYVILDSTSNRLPKAARERMGSAVGDLENAAKRGDIFGLAHALGGAVDVLAQPNLSGSTLPVVQDGESIHIGRHFRVSFCRTLRVPDDSKTYPLPAGFGFFPLHSVADFADRVPPKWLDNGGLFLPMYQSEAMFLSFGGVSWRPNVAKVGVGKVNAVSGKPWDERIRVQEQDYLLCPEQRWLDGINAGSGYVHQLVAMPLGQGYTIEEQVTDEDRFGGIQIVAYEPKNGIFPEEDPAEVERRAKEAGVNALLMDRSSNLPEPFQSVLKMSIMGFSIRHIVISMSLPPDLVEQYELAAKKECAKNKWRKYEAGEGAQRLVEDIQREGIRRLAAIVGKSLAEKLEWKLFPPHIRYSLAKPEMGVAAGGKIKQKIIEDVYGAEAWDENARGSVWIHLVNSEIYQRITGKRPPDKPMDAAEYKRRGVPWFNYYEEGRATVGPSRILSRIKSVFAIDQQRGRVHAHETSIPVDPTKVMEVRIPSSKERIIALLSATEAAAGAGRHKSASRLATAILDIDSHNVQALCLRGEAHLGLGLYESARNDAESVIKSQSENWTARRIRAEAALMLKMPELALAEASAALQLSNRSTGLQDIVVRAKAAIKATQKARQGE